MNRELAIKGAMRRYQLSEKVIRIISPESYARGKFDTVSVSNLQNAKTWRDKEWATKK